MTLKLNQTNPISKQTLVIPKGKIFIKIQDHSLIWCKRRYNNIPMFLTKQQLVSKYENQI